MGGGGGPQFSAFVLRSVPNSLISDIMKTTTEILSMAPKDLVSYLTLQIHRLSAVYEMHQLETRIFQLARFLPSVANIAMRHAIQRSIKQEKKAKQQTCTQSMSESTVHSSPNVPSDGSKSRRDEDASALDEWFRLLTIPIERVCKEWMSFLESPQNTKHEIDDQLGATLQEVVTEILR